MHTTGRIIRTFVALVSGTGIAFAAAVTTTTPGIAAASTPAPAPVIAPGGAVPVVVGPAPAQPTYVAPPPAPASSGLHASVLGGSSFVVNYDAGFDANPAAKTAFQFAVDQWSKVIASPVPIVINASFAPLGTGILGSAGPSSIISGFANQPHASTWYPIALANALSGTDLNGSSPEISAQFSSTYANFYFGTDGNTGGRIDFASVVMHELGHGLGFYGMADGGTGACCDGTYGMPGIYDRFTTSDGTALLGYANGSALATAMQGHDVRFAGSTATAAAGGTAPKLYAPASWQSGSSYSHLDEATYPAGDVNSLMTPAIGPNEVIHNPGPIVLGVFHDMGWTVGTTPTISVGNARAVEGNSGNRTMRFTVSLSQPAVWDVSAHFATADGTAVAPGDYTSRSGTIVIPAGSVATSVAVTVKGDAIVEGAERFTFRLSAPAGATLGRATGTGTINNDDPASGGVVISAGDASVIEGNSGDRVVTIPVTLSQVKASTVTVAWATGTGTATDGVDYTSASGTATFPAGSATQYVTFVVHPDTTTESAETVPIVLSSPAGGVLGRATGYGTITDDD